MRVEGWGWGWGNPINLSAWEVGPEVGGEGAVGVLGKGGVGSPWSTPGNEAAQGGTLREHEAMLGPGRPVGCSSLEL